MDTDKTPILTITIPTWNRHALLASLLKSLSRGIRETNHEKDIKLFVSNNASEDETLVFLNDFSKQESLLEFQTNRTNLGAKRNVLLSLEKPVTPFVLITGDDDSLSADSFRKIILHLKAHPDTGLLLDTSVFRKPHDVDSIVEISQEKLTREFYWYMGNATVFVTRTEYFKIFLQEFGYDFFNECWPQTQVIQLGLNRFGHRIYAGDLGIPSVSQHTEVMAYNSFYLWRTRILDLYRSAKDIFPDMPNAFKNDVAENIASDAFTNMLNILQFALFIDEADQRVKTRTSIRQNFFLFPFRLMKWHFIMVFVLSMPLLLSRPLSWMFVRLLRGKKGIQKLEQLMAKETVKRSKMKEIQNKALRKLEFEKD